MANESGVADHRRTTRKPFPYKQETEEEFRRCRRIPGLRGSHYTKYTYFMRDRISGHIKIGMSQSPWERRANLSSSGFRDMEILLLLRGGELEGAYHKHFDDLCVGGEWFVPHDDILAEIERLKPESAEC